MFGIRTIAYLLLILLTIDDVAMALDNNMSIPVRMEKFNRVLKRVNELHNFNISKTIQELDELAREQEEFSTHNFNFSHPPDEMAYKPGCCVLVVGILALTQAIMAIRIQYLVMHENYVLSVTTNNSTGDIGVDARGHRELMVLANAQPVISIFVLLAMCMAVVVILPSTTTQKNNNKQHIAVSSTREIELPTVPSAVEDQELEDDEDEVLAQALSEVNIAPDQSPTTNANMTS